MASNKEEHSADAHHNGQQHTHLPPASELLEHLAEQVAPTIAPRVAEAAHAFEGPAGRFRHDEQAEQEEAAAEEEAVARHIQAVLQHNEGRHSLELVLPQVPNWAALVEEDYGHKARETLKLELGALHAKDAKEGRRLLVEHAMRTMDQDNGPLLRAIKQRMERVGMAFPTVEVRFSDINVDAKVMVGTRGMPSVLNFFRGKVEAILRLAHLWQPETRPFSVLSNVSGVLKPGRLTLLLGPPSSGKSTLLKLLAGSLRQHEARLQGLELHGSVTYNGETLDQFQVRRTATMVEQVDNHLGEMTVRETFDFAAACLGVGTANELLKELRAREKAAGITPDPVIDAYMKAAAVEGGAHSLRTETQLKLLDLNICADTVIGGQMLRGVSGGQRKRVTTGEFLVGPHQVLMMDEISTGLDASTTRILTQNLRNAAHHQQATILVALLQPPPEVLELFDDVMLLSDGMIVYHGPREQVVPFFASLGFEPPARKCVADFLQEVTSRKDQGLYWTRPEPYTYVPVADMVRAFEASPLGRKRSHDLTHATDLTIKVTGKADGVVSPALSAHTTTGGGANGNPPSPDSTPSAAGAKQAMSSSSSITKEPKPPVTSSEHWPADPLARTPFALPGWLMLKANIIRDYVLMTRLGFLWGFKTFQALFVGIIFSTLFVKSRMGYSTVADGSLYLAIIFYSITHSLFNGYVEMSILIQGLRVFFKQRNARMFPAWCYTIPPVILRVPFSAVDALLWSCLVYWITGMAPSASRFFIFLAYMFLMSQMALALFRAIGALARNMDLANSFGSTALILLLLVSGFILAKPNIHPWWIWAFWISPITYTQQALSINELTHPRWDTPIVFQGQNTTVGLATLRSFGLFESRMYVWLGAVVLIGYTILFQILAFFFLTVLDEPPMPPPLVSEEFLAARHANIHGGDGNDATAASGNNNKSGGGTTAAIAAAPAVPSQVQMSAVAAVADDHRAAVTAAKLPSGALALPSATSAPSASSAIGPASRTSVDRGGRKSLEAILGAAGQGGNGGGMALPFTPTVVSFSKICYSVDMPPQHKDFESLRAAGDARPQLRLLTDITGSFRPGVLTALMGVSGAGKTTLMDVLAGRKTIGTITGDMRVDGFPVNQQTFARVCGYVEQADVHCPRTTVREAIYISGRLRLADTSKEVLEAFVDEVMNLVELGPQAGALVGLPGQFGLSVEARKRLTIGVELVANPSVVFMDEPTSGLDARAAAVVMRAVRNTVNTGRTVVCTIHQPSIDIFESFDELLLLKRGGRTIFCGELGRESSKLISYFSSIKGVPECPPTLNPATWMLEISSPGEEARLGNDFADEYLKSRLLQQNEELVARLGQPKAGAQPLTFKSGYAHGWKTQFKVLLQRNLAQYWRNPSYNGVRYMFCTILGLLLGSIFWDLGMKRTTPTDVFNVMGALFICITFLGTSNASGVLPVLASERPVFYRETGSKMYAPLPYALALGIVEIPYVIVQSILYGTITYFMIHFELQAAKFFWYLLFVFLTLSFFTFYGFAIVAVMPIPELSAVISAMFYSLWFVLGGFFISEPAMPPWWRWLYYINPLSYALYGIIGSQLCDVADQYVSVGDGTSVTVSAFIQQTLNFKESFVGPAAAIQAGFIVAFWVAFILAITKINHNKR